MNSIMIISYLTICVLIVLVGHSQQRPYDGQNNGYGINGYGSNGRYNNPGYDNYGYGNHQHDQHGGNGMMRGQNPNDQQQFNGRNNNDDGSYNGMLKILGNSMRMMGIEDESKTTILNRERRNSKQYSGPAFFPMMPQQNQNDDDWLTMLLVYLIKQFGFAK